MSSLELDVYLQTVQTFSVRAGMRRFIVSELGALNSVRIDNLLDEWEMMLHITQRVVRAINYLGVGEPLYGLP
jgi:hypothetical protein